MLSLFADAAATLIFHADVSFSYCCRLARCFRRHFAIICHTPFAAICRHARRHAAAPRARLMFCRRAMRRHFSLFSC